MTQLVGDGSRVLPLTHRRQAPLLSPGQPTRPLHVPGWNPPWHIGVGIAPFRGDVLWGVELHLPELLPNSGLIVARVNPQDGVVFPPQVPDVLTDVGCPNGVTIRLHATAGLASVRRGLILTILVEAVLPSGLRHPVGAENLYLGDAEFPAGLFHPVAVDGLPVVHLAGGHEEVGVELRHLFPGNRIDLGIAEGIRSAGQGDDEGLIRKVDGHKGDFEPSLGDQSRIGPIDAGNGAIIVPCHEVLILDDLRIDGLKGPRSPSPGLAPRHCQGGSHEESQDGGVG